MHTVWDDEVRIQFLGWTLREILRLRMIVQTCEAACQEIPHQNDGRIIYKIYKNRSEITSIIFYSSFQCYTCKA